MFLIGFKLLSLNHPALKEAQITPAVLKSLLALPMSSTSTLSFFVAQSEE
jgi:hypothetical protein